MYPRNQAIARIGYQELSFIQWTMLIEPIHLPIPSITVLGYQGDHCTCIWLFGTPRFLAAKCQIQKVSPVLNVEAREFQPKIENYAILVIHAEDIVNGILKASHHLFTQLFELFFSTHFVFVALDPIMTQI